MYEIKQKLTELLNQEIKRNKEYAIEATRSDDYIRAKAMVSECDGLDTAIRLIGKYFSDLEKSQNREEKREDGISKAIY